MVKDCSKNKIKHKLGNDVGQCPYCFHIDCMLQPSEDSRGNPIMFIDFVEPAQYDKKNLEERVWNKRLQKMAVNTEKVKRLKNVWFFQTYLRNERLIARCPLCIQKPSGTIEGQIVELKLSNKAFTTEQSLATFSAGSKSSGAGRRAKRRLERRAPDPTPKKKEIDNEMNIVF
jgi:hypothetical protein